MRRAARRLGLRWQVLVGLIGALVLAIVLVSSAMLGLTQRALVQQALRHAEGVGQTASTIVAASVDPGTAFDAPANVRDFERICQLFAEERDGARAVVVAIDGDSMRSVASWPNGLRFEAEVSERQRAALEARALDSRVAERDGLRLIEVFAPVLGAQGPPAAVLVEFPLYELQRTISASQRAIVLYIALDALLLLVVGYLLLTRGVVRPIATISAATERVAEGDFDMRIDVVAQNEIGDLAENFDRMVQRLRAGRDALRERVDELAQANEALARAQREVVRTERMATLGALSAGIAHEIGNPLAAVTGLLELLEDHQDMEPDQIDDLVERIERELGRLNRIISELLDYARVREVEAGPIDVAPAIERAVRLTAHHPRGRHISVTLDVLPTLQPAVIDEGRLVQVMLNLLLNAADACGASGGTVQVRAGRDPARQGAVLIEVEDDGPGIDAATLARLFEPFYTTKRAGEGTGLGLPICERIVSDVGGSIEVASVVGEGTTFRIQLLGEEAYREVRGSSSPGTPSGK